MGLAPSTPRQRKEVMRKLKLQMQVTMTSNRRGFLQAAGTGVAGMTISDSGMASAAAGPVKPGPEGPDGPVLLIGDNIALADTQYGKVRGYVLRGIHYFLGIPYGADTSGA